ncbi:hypothetical protein NNA33_19830 [Marisediminitalea aggregata]|uniref:hypothetical protein n=1 Tax=Marisediminitalea aggregata TaxID=634436 RepID=UPI0020CCCB9C|nr:hypothetical protein [Marisediminitalea aggregata]MCP9480145.1 hypothetical protein [Marisediminitalea aggregata]
MYWSNHRASTFVLFILGLTLHSYAAVAGLGKLSDVLSTGYSDGWNAMLKQDTYWLENTSQQGAIRYYYADYNGQQDQRVISVKIQLNASAPNSEAGVLYGFDRAQATYFLMTITAGRTFNVTLRDKNGFRQLFQTSLDINLSAFNTITIEEEGHKLTYFVNNNKVGELTHPSAGKGSSGIVAVGTGKFGFTDFVENNAPLTHKLPTAQTVITTMTALNEPQVTHSIKDEFGFDRPMEAMTINMPESWDVKGLVQWYGKSTCTMDISTPKVHLKGSAKNGMQWLEIIPGGVWAWNSNFDTMPQLYTSTIAGCDSKPIVDIETFVNQYIRSIRPHAKINSVRQRPDIIQDIMKEQAQDIHQFQQQYPNMRLRPEAMEVDLTYFANNKKVNELLETTVIFIDSPILDANGGMGGIMTISMAQGSILTAAVNGQADRKLLDSISDSIVNNAEYQARLRQMMNQRARLMAQATQRQIAANRAYRQSMASANTAQNYNDILDSNMASWNRIQEMKDAGQRKLVDATLERTPWQTTSGESVYMPQQYQRVFQLPNGVFAGTNDSFFNPINGNQLNEYQY